MKTFTLTNIQIFWNERRIARNMHRIRYTFASIDHLSSINQSIYNIWYDNGTLFLSLSSFLRLLPSLLACDLMIFSPDLLIALTGKHLNNL